MLFILIMDDFFRKIIFKISRCFFCGGRGLNLGPCIFYTMSLSTELNSREQISRCSFSRIKIEFWKNKKLIFLEFWKTRIFTFQNDIFIMKKNIFFLGKKYVLKNSIIFKQFFILKFDKLKFEFSGIWWMYKRFVFEIFVNLWDSSKSLGVGGEVLP